MRRRSTVFMFSSPAPNPSIERTATSRLRLLASAAHVERWASQPHGDAVTQRQPRIFAPPLPRDGLPFAVVTELNARAPSCL